MTTKRKDKDLHIRINGRKLKTIKRLAKEQYRNISSVAEEALDDWLNKQR